MENYRVINIKDIIGRFDEAVDYYYSKWGREGNYDFFYDAMRHSSNSESGLPRFYVLLKGNQIIGCCGLVINDFISRHDLMPWLGGVFIERNERGHNLSNFMMQRVEEDAQKIGFNKVYLTTDHDGFYEKYGWQRMEDGFDPNGLKSRIYWKDL